MIELEESVHSPPGLENAAPGTRKIFEIETEANFEDRASSMDVSNPLDINDYIYILYGTMSTLAFTTKVFPTSDADVYPLYQRILLGRIHRATKQGDFIVLYQRPCIWTLHIHVQIRR